MTDEAMTDEEVKLLEYDFLPEKMREAKITADKGKCRMVLSMLIAGHELPHQEKLAQNVNYLSELGEIDKSECQEILDELVNAKFVWNFGPSFDVTDEFAAAWKLRRIEAAFEL